MYWNLAKMSVLYNSNRLTLTWDVLKCFTAIFCCGSVYGLTLTWDVLKYGNRKEGTVTITD